MNKKMQALQRVLTDRILVLDGAQGTFIQSRSLSAADYGAGLAALVEAEGLVAPRFPQRGNHQIDRREEQC